MSIGATSRLITVKTPPTRIRLSSAYLSTLPFVEPGHLNRLESALTRGLRVIVEAGEVQDPFPQVREPHRQGIDVRVPLDQRDGDGLSVGPFHTASQWPLGLGLQALGVARLWSLEAEISPDPFSPLLNVVPR